MGMAGPRKMKLFVPSMQNTYERCCIRPDNESETILCEKKLLKIIELLFIILKQC